MRMIELRYTLRGGSRGRLMCMSRSTTDAVVIALELWGDALRTCSARCV